MEKRVAGSFRDPSGIVFLRDGKILRQVNSVYKENYEFLISSGLYDRLSGKKWLICHQEVPDEPLYPEPGYKVIQPETIPFISYPYEWSFSQLKDAALLTLAIQKEALKAGMILKDSSAYNIQFHQSAPVMIDTLSFAKYVEGEPWVAYRQFCQHFLAPLALISKVDVRLSKMLIDHIDGIPLDLCSRLLPASTRWNIGLLTHIHVHAKAQRHYSVTAGTDELIRKTQKARISRNGLLGLIESLESTLRGLTFKVVGKDWADYYSETNYTEAAFQAKHQIVRELVLSTDPRLILDLGANTGVFSRAMADLPNCFIISSDIDPEAVEINYSLVKKQGIKNILPLVIDMANPSPGIGWDNQEREPFFKRARADVVMALALVHHLAIANNIPLADIARSMASLGANLVLEFVPKEDSQVKRLLASRDDIFEDYSLPGLLAAFEPYFSLQRQIPITGSQRTMLLFTRKHGAD